MDYDLINGTLSSFIRFEPKICGTILGVIVAHVYFIGNGMKVCSVFTLFENSKSSVETSYAKILCALLTNVILVHGVVTVFYEATTTQQYGFASLSVVALLSGHMSFKEFSKAAAGG